MSKPKYKIGDPCWANGNPGMIKEVLKDGTYCVLMDRSRFDGDKPQQEVIEEEQWIDPAEYAPIERWAVAGKTPTHTGHGYIITQDGTIYSLIRQWAHGIVCAKLFPELATKSGYRQPCKEADVFHFQRFELDNHNDMPVVRIAFGMMTPCAVNKGRQACPPAQIEATRLALVESGKKLNDTVMGDWRDMTVRTLLKELAKEGINHDDD